MTLLYTPEQAKAELRSFAQLHKEDLRRKLREHDATLI